MVAQDSCLPAALQHITFSSSLSYVFFHRPFGSLAVVLQQHSTVAATVTHTTAEEDVHKWKLCCFLPSPSFLHQERYPNRQQEWPLQWPSDTQNKRRPTQADVTTHTSCWGSCSSFLGSHSMRQLPGTTHPRLQKQLQAQPWSPGPKEASPATPLSSVRKLNRARHHCRRCCFHFLVYPLLGKKNDFVLDITSNYSCWAGPEKCQQCIVSANWGVHAPQ